MAIVVIGIAEPIHASQTLQYYFLQIATLQLNKLGL